MSTQTPQLMLTEQPAEEFQDFINYSLSDGCFSISKFQSKGNNVSQNSIQDNSTPLSPNQQHLLKPSTDHSEQKPINQSRPSISVTQERVYRDFFQYFLIQKFIHRISFKKKLNSLFDKYHFDVINDLGATFNLNLFRDHIIKLRPIISKPIPKVENQWVTKFNKIKQLIALKFQTLINRIPLIYPESRLKMLWDVTVMAARFYFIYIIPMDLAWESQSFMFDSLIVPTSVMLTLLILDFVLSFNNAYYEFGSIVTERKKIAYYVFTKSYSLDILSVLILVIFLAISQIDGDQVNLTENWYHLLLLLFLIQYKNISKLTEQAEEALNLSKQVSSLLELGKLILTLFFVLHIFSCLWFYVGIYSYRNNNQTWLQLKGLEEATWNTQYLYSFYYSTVTMFTIGYGDITPQSTLEVVLSIMFMMICSIQLSYSVSTVGAIIDRISFYTKEKRKKVQTINTYMQHKKISYELQFKIREYLNYYWQCNQQEETEEEKNIINQLSENLRESLQFEANSMILNNCPLFKNHFSEQLKKKLVKKIRSIVVQPENIIDFDHLFPGQQKNQFICFVEEGQIQIFIENEMSQNHVQYNSISVVSTVSRGSSLGLMSFITGIKARERFKSLGFSKLLLLSRDDFLKIVPEFPEDYEVFREMHDDLIYNSDSEFLKLACFSCKSLQHKAIDCPQVHFIPDKEYLIKKHQFSRDQKRNENFKFRYRRNQKRLHSFFSPKVDIDLVQETADLFQAENYKQCLFYEELDDELEKQQLKSPTSELLKKVANYPLKDSIQEVDESDFQFAVPPINQRKSQLNKITKKSISLLVDEDMVPLQQYKGINKFRRAVEVVRNLNKITNKKSLKAQTKNILASFNGDNYKETEQLSLLNSIKKRLKYIEDHNIECIDRELQEMEFLKMRLQMLIKLNIQKYDKFDQIETVKQFKFYNTHNNVDQILVVYNEFYKVKLKELENIPQVFRQFVRYLMYPYQFINKYKFKQDDFNKIVKQDENQKQKNKFSKLLTLHRQSKNLRKKMMVKKAQIKPI